jgi:iron complex transport system permease protein
VVDRKPNGRGWDDLRPIAVTLVLVVPVVLLVARHIRALELGDDAARGLGVRVERSRAVLLVAGVALAAVATASAGPIGFVALMAPQITRQLVGGRALGLLPAATGGALLVVASDLGARQLFAPIELPVGLITAVLGAPYLLYLIARSDRHLSGE